MTRDYGHGEYGAMVFGITITDVVTTASNADPIAPEYPAVASL